MLRSYVVGTMCVSSITLTSIVVTHRNEMSEASASSLLITSSFSRLLPIFSIRMALRGSSVRFSQSCSSLVRKTARATLMPPAVEPAQPPMIMKTDVISRAACDQPVISVDCSPVHVMPDMS